jgi:hypothetical protein
MGSHMRRILHGFEQYAMRTMQSVVRCGSRVRCSHAAYYMIKMRLESRAAFTKANASAFLGLGRLVSLGAVGL